MLLCNEKTCSDFAILSTGASAPNVLHLKFYHFQLMLNLWFENNWRRFFLNYHILALEKSTWKSILNKKKNNANFKEICGCRCFPNDFNKNINGNKIIQNINVGTFFRCSFHTTKQKAPDQLNIMSKMCFGIDNIDYIWVTKLVESDCLKHISQWKFVSSFQQYDKCQERANTLNWLTFFWNGKSGHCSVFLIVLSLLPNFCICVSVKSNWIEQII